MGRKQKSDPKIYTPNAFFQSVVHGDNPEEYKERQEKTFESLICEQYYSAMSYPKEVIKSRRDSDKLLSFSEAEWSCDYSIVLAYNKVLTWEKFHSLPIQQVLKHLAEFSEDIVIFDDGVGSYRGLAFAKSKVKFKSDRVVGRMTIDNYGTSKVAVQRPYDLFLTMWKHNYLTRYSD